MKRILITAFEPFGEDKINPTAEIIRVLPDRIILSGDQNCGSADRFALGGSQDSRSADRFALGSSQDSGSADREAELIKLVLPVSFIRAPQIAEAAVVEHSPDAVISLGLAGGRAAVTPERIAVNCMDARMPDNDGYLPEDLPIVPDGPAAYFSTLPIKKIRDAVRAGGIPSEISNSAGTYVCNAVMYRMLYLAAKVDGRMRCGFIHVPYSESMGKTPALTLDEEIKAVKMSVEAVICSDF